MYNTIVFNNLNDGDDLNGKGYIQLFT